MELQTSIGFISIPEPRHLPCASSLFLEEKTLGRTVLKRDEWEFPDD
jgi:hypothetical protein